MRQLDFKKGYTPRFAGAPAARLDRLPDPQRVALLPRRIPLVKPRLVVERGDRVALGAPLFEDKRHPNIRFMSPGGGRVARIDFGPRRVIERIVIELDVQEERVAREPLTAADIAEIARPDLVQRLVEGGIWPFLRALPFRDYPLVDTVPPAIYVSLGNLEPFQPAPAVYLQGRSERFAFGVGVLKRLAADPDAVRVVASAHHLKEVAPLVNGNLTHAVKGPYPALDPGVLLYHLRTSAEDNRAWYIDGQDLLLLAEFLQTGVYPTRRILAVAGPRAPQARHVATRLGVPLSLLAPGLSADGEVRWVAGGFFTGYADTADSYMGLFQTALNLLPEGNEREFLALVNPGPRKPTYSRTFLSALNPADVETDCNLHGGLRACIACGYCNEVCPVDILPQLTYKSVLADEIEESLALGLLDCVECGLCTYVCPSKIELAATLQKARAAFYKGRG